MHTRNILHRDLKPENMLLMDEKDLKITITDFGMATFFNQINQNAQYGSPYYMSPEMVNFDSPNEKTDIWSIGVIAYELLTGEMPFDGDDLEDLQRAICKDKV